MVIKLMAYDALFAAYIILNPLQMTVVTKI